MTAPTEIVYIWGLEHGVLPLFNKINIPINQNLKNILSLLNWIYLWVNQAFSSGEGGNRRLTDEESTI